jgi:hypothetical protein
MNPNPSDFPTRTSFRFAAASRNLDSEPAGTPERKQGNALSANDAGRAFFVSGMLAECVGFAFRPIDYKRYFRLKK